MKLYHSDWIQFWDFMSFWTPSLFCLLQHWGKAHVHQENEIRQLTWQDLHGDVLQRRNFHPCLEMRCTPPVIYWQVRHENSAFRDVQILAEICFCQNNWWKTTSSKWRCKFASLKMRLHWDCIETAFLQSQQNQHVQLEISRWCNLWEQRFSRTFICHKAHFRWPRLRKANFCTRKHS